MSQLSLGIIETLGLATGIHVADICVKSANVNLIGYEFSKGAGMTVIKIEGNVGAVNAAVDAALASTDRIAFSKVIPRPNPEIEKLIRNKDTVGYKAVIEKQIEEQIGELPKEVEKSGKTKPEKLKPEKPKADKEPEPEKPEPELKEVKEVKEVKESKEAENDSEKSKKKPKKR